MRKWKIGLFFPLVAILLAAAPFAHADDPVAGEIITTGQNSPDPLKEVSSDYNTVREWLDGWVSAIRTADVVDVDTLETCWVSGGNVVCEEADRIEGESDALFKERHINQVLWRMSKGGDPPDP